MSNLKKHYKALKKCYLNESVQCLLLIIPILLGMFGFCIYYRSAGANAVLSFFRALFSTIRLFGASYDLDYSKCSEIPYVVYILGIAKWLALWRTSVAIFALLRPFCARFFNNISLRFWRRKKQRVLIVGNTEENRLIFQSISRQDEANLLVSTLTECDTLKKADFPAIVAKQSGSGKRTEKELLTDQENLIRELISDTLTDTKRRTSIIVNTNDDVTNLHICKTVVEELGVYTKEDRKRLTDAASSDREMRAAERRIVERLRRLRVVVFGSRSFQAAYQDLQNDSLGILNCINKSQLTAYDFVVKYPFTDIMDADMYRKHIHNACVSPDLELNMILVGFGDTNQEIFTTSFAVNQYVEGRPGEIPQPKKINYHIFDRSDVLQNKNLNHTVFHYGSEFLQRVSDGQIAPEEYFALPESPANTVFHHTDINSVRFYREIAEICQNRPSSVTYLVISVGTDVENLDLAQRLAEKRLEWEIPKTGLRLFARVRGDKADEVSRAISDDDYTVFGNERELVYRYDRILWNTVEELAIRRNLMYEREEKRRGRSTVAEEDLETYALCRWFLMNTNRRMSNIYGILSLRMKLQLLGLDYSDKAVVSSALDTNDAYYRRYAAGNYPTVIQPKGSAGEEDIYSDEFLKMPEDFRQDNARNNLTVQEHCRWNAFMFSCGFIPEKKKNIFSGRVRDYSKRTHGNLTTFEGLFDFRKELTRHNGKTELENDVIRYDYQIMDNAWWFLHSAGYTVYQRYDTIHQNYAVLP